MEGQCFIYTKNVGGRIKVIGSRNNGPLGRGQEITAGVKTAGACLGELAIDT